MDDDRLYQLHSDSGEESEWEGATQGNINRFKHRLRDSASEAGSVGSNSPVDGDMEERRKEERREEEEEKRRESDSGDEDIIIEHVSLTQNVGI